jgi:hypothetical protein
VAADRGSIPLITKPSPSTNQRKPHRKRKDSSTNAGIAERTVSRSKQHGARGIGRIQHTLCWQQSSGWKKRDRRRAYQQAWYQRKLQKIQTQRQAAYPAFRDQVRARSKAYYDAHRAAVRERQHRYYFRKKAEKLQALHDG